MKRPRPYIPLDVQLEVALRLLFGKGEEAHLDHDPPLRSREFNPITLKYKPDANDPDYLVWRDKEGHRVKTYVRGEHGQYSDTILIARERKREKKKAGLKPAYHWPKRKIRNRKNAVLSGKIR